MGSQLIIIFAWSEAEFLHFTEGSPIRRIGHERWLRNVAVALGNAYRTAGDPALAAALRQRLDHPSELVREHVLWALSQKAFSTPSARGRLTIPSTVDTVTSAAT
jgi:epoxyqueuosine reductase